LVLRRERNGPDRGAAVLCYLEIARDLGAISSKVRSSSTDNAPALLRSSMRTNLFPFFGFEERNLLKYQMYFGLACGGENCPF
jgi:hypothetical protein